MVALPPPRFSVGERAVQETMSEKRAALRPLGIRLGSLALTVGFGVLLAAAAQAADAPKKSAARAKAPAGGGNSDEKIADELKAFCIKWMGFLETRERDNRKAVKWQKRQEGVGGQFVGYSKEYDCIMKERSSNGTPVATIVYREYVYEQKGPSQGEAAQSTPNVVDATEVTEIFRYTKGEWVY